MVFLPSSTQSRTRAMAALYGAPGAAFVLYNSSLHVPPGSATPPRRGIAVFAARRAGAPLHALHAERSGAAPLGQRAEDRAGAPRVLLVCLLLVRPHPL